MASKAKANIGDVFEIPIDSARVGYGQVVSKPERPVLFIIVFAATSAPNTVVKLDEIVRSEIVFAGSTFDAKLFHGNWRIVGNFGSNLRKVILPVYKYGMGETAMVETLDRSRSRRATKREEMSLTFRHYSAPIIFESALKAFHGTAPWLEGYDDLKYERLLRGSNVKV